MLRLVFCSIVLLVFLKENVYTKAQFIPNRPNDNTETKTSYKYLPYDSNQQFMNHAIQEDPKIKDFFKNEHINPNVQQIYINQNGQQVLRSPQVQQVQRIVYSQPQVVTEISKEVIPNADDPQLQEISKEVAEFILYFIKKYCKSGMNMNTLQQALLTKGLLTSFKDISVAQNQIPLNLTPESNWNNIKDQPEKLTNNWDIKYINKFPKSSIVETITDSDKNPERKFDTDGEKIDLYNKKTSVKPEITINNNKKPLKLDQNQLTESTQNPIEDELSIIYFPPKESLSLEPVQNNPEIEHIQEIPVPLDEIKTLKPNQEIIIIQKPLEYNKELLEPEITIHEITTMVPIDGTNLVLPQEDKNNLRKNLPTPVVYTNQWQQPGNSEYKPLQKLGYQNEYIIPSQNKQDFPNTYDYYAPQSPTVNSYNSQIPEYSGYNPIQYLKNLEQNIPNKYESPQKQVYKWQIPENLGHVPIQDNKNKVPEQTNKYIPNMYETPTQYSQEYNWQIPENLKYDPAHNNEYEIVHEVPVPNNKDIPEKYEKYFPQHPKEQEYTWQIPEDLEHVPTHDNKHEIPNQYIPNIYETPIQYSPEYNWQTPENLVYDPVQNKEYDIVHEVPVHDNKDIPNKYETSFPQPQEVHTWQIPKYLDHTPEQNKEYDIAHEIPVHDNKDIPNKYETSFPQPQKVHTWQIPKYLDHTPEQNKESPNWFEVPTQYSPKEHLFNWQTPNNLGYVPVQNQIAFPQFPKGQVYTWPIPEHIPVQNKEIPNNYEPSSSTEYSYTWKMPEHVEHTPIQHVVQGQNSKYIPNKFEISQQTPKGQVHTMPIPKYIPVQNKGTPNNYESSSSTEDSYTWKIPEHIEQIKLENSQNVPDQNSKDIPNKFESTTQQSPKEHEHTWKIPEHVLKQEKDNKNLPEQPNKETPNKYESYSSTEYSYTWQEPEHLDIFPGQHEENLPNQNTNNIPNTYESSAEEFPKEHVPNQNEKYEEPKQNNKEIPNNYESYSTTEYFEHLTEQQKENHNVPEVTDQNTSTQQSPKEHIHGHFEHVPTENNGEPEHNKKDLPNTYESSTKLSPKEHMHTWEIPGHFEKNYEVPEQYYKDIPHKHEFSPQEPPKEHVHTWEIPGHFEKNYEVPEQYYKDIPHKHEFSPQESPKEHVHTWEIPEYIEHVPVLNKEKQSPEKTPIKHHSYSYQTSTEYANTWQIPENFPVQHKDIQNIHEIPNIYSNVYNWPTPEYSKQIPIEQQIRNHNIQIEDPVYQYEVSEQKNKNPYNILSNVMNYQETQQPELENIQQYLQNYNFPNMYFNQKNDKLPTDNSQIEWWKQFGTNNPMQMPNMYYQRKSNSKNDKYYEIIEYEGGTSKYLLFDDLKIYADNLLQKYLTQLRKIKKLKSYAQKTLSSSQFQKFSKNIKEIQKTLNDWSKSDEFYDPESINYVTKTITGLGKDLIEMLEAVPNMTTATTESTNIITTVTGSSTSTSSEGTTIKSSTDKIDSNDQGERRNYDGEEISTLPEDLTTLIPTTTTVATTFTPVTTATIPTTTDKLYDILQKDVLKQDGVIGKNIKFRDAVLAYLLLSKKENKSKLDHEHLYILLHQLKYYLKDYPQFSSILFIIELKLKQNEKYVTDAMLKNNLNPTFFDNLSYYIINDLKTKIKKEFGINVHEKLFLGLLNIPYTEVTHDLIVKFTKKLVSELKKYSLIEPELANIKIIAMTESELEKLAINDKIDLISNSLTDIINKYPEYARMLELNDFPSISSYVNDDASFDEKINAMASLKTMNKNNNNGIADQQMTWRSSDKIPYGVHKYTYTINPQSFETKLIPINKNIVVQKMQPTYTHYYSPQYLSTSYTQHLPIETDSTTTSTTTTTTTTEAPKLIEKHNNIFRKFMMKMDEKEATENTNVEHKRLIPNDLESSTKIEDIK